MSKDSIPPYPNAQRWPIAIAGTLLQICLGTVYAWSYFQDPIKEQYGWSDESLTWTFSLAICFLGIAAAIGGFQLKKGKIAPRPIAVTGGILFALGHFIAACALYKHQLWLLLFGYGVVGGTGLGLAYVVPVATAAKWFPDKQGFITGMVVMGFGLGALLMSKILAPITIKLCNGNLAIAFVGMGCVFALLAPAAAWFMKNPPQKKSDAAAFRQEHFTESDKQDDSGNWGKFVLVWIIFFCNIFVGLSIISFQSPLIKDLLRIENPNISVEALATGGATLIAVGAIFNGLGRFFWGAVSDRIGQSWTFSVMLVTEILVLALLSFVGNPIIFGALICYILLCYGGGFGTIPSYILSLFGEKRMALLYGIVLTAWSTGGIAGPKLMAYLRQNNPENASQTAFLISIGVLAFALILSLLPAVRTKR